MVSEDVSTLFRLINWLNKSAESYYKNKVWLYKNDEELANKTTKTITKTIDNFGFIKYFFERFLVNIIDYTQLLKPGNSNSISL